MKVGMNLLFLGPGAGGVGTYAVELAGALAAREDVSLELFVTESGLAVLEPRGFLDSVRVRRLPVSRERRGSYLAVSLAGVSVLGALSRLDVLHSPANVGPVIAPGVTSVLTVHDLIWMRYGTEWDSASAVTSMERSTKLTVPRAQRIITVSAASRDDLVSLLGVKSDRVDVVPHGVRARSGVPITADAELRNRLGLGDGRLLLCVAQKRPYKGQERLVRALPDLPEDVVLVLPGAPTDYETYLRELACTLGVGSRVVFPEWVDESDLEGLYRAATCFVLASEMEGFGLPVLEAMARGLPVACSDTSSLPEVAGGAAVLFDPADQAGVTGAIRRMLEDGRLRERLAERGLKRAAEFTWERTAQATVEAYRRAVGTS